ncbi:hypothetical protein ACKVWH_011431 [Pyricularia oryzae]
MELLYANSRLFVSYKSVLQENIMLRKQSAQCRSTPESDADSKQDSTSQLRESTSRHQPSEERVEQLRKKDVETALRPRLEICCPHCKNFIVTGEKQEGAYAPTDDRQDSSSVDDDDLGGLGLSHRMWMCRPTRW